MDELQMMVSGRLKKDGRDIVRVSFSGTRIMRMGSCRVPSLRNHQDSKKRNLRYWRNT